MCECVVRILSFLCIYMYDGLFIRVCGSLKVLGHTHHLIGSGTPRRCGFVGVGTTLLEEVSSVRTGFEATCIQDTTQCLSQLSVACKI